MYKTIYRMALIAFVLSILTSCSAFSAGIEITPESGGFKVHSGSYDVAVLPDGGLSSIRSGNAEFLNITNEFHHGAYLYQNGVLSLNDVKQDGDSVIAKSDKAVIKYSFQPDTVNVSITNNSSEVLNFFAIIDAGVKAASNGKGQFVKLPVTNDWNSIDFFRDGIKLQAGGSSRLWGPWNGQQVFDITVNANQTKQASFQVSKAGSDETEKAAKIMIPKELLVEDINVLSPKVYQVFQRSSLYDGYILVSGWVRPECDKVMVRVTGKSIKGDLPGKWQAISVNPQTRSFTSRIKTVPGGWYNVDIKAMNGRKLVAKTNVEKVGVGEIFVGAGQSNSTNCGQFTTKQTSGMVSSFSGEYWQIADDPQPGTHDKTGGGSFWPAFGDVMYAKYHVPIGVAVTGHGGTSVTQWQPDDPLGLYPWMMTRIHQLGPMGFRAVLWHQGETDAVMPTEEYVQKMTTVIRKSNIDAGWSFPWFVAHASYHNAQNSSWPLVRAAQKELWDKGIALQGPDTDVLTGDNRDFDGNGIHFSPKGLHAHGKMWADMVSPYLDKVLGIKK